MNLVKMKNNQQIPEGWKFNKVDEFANIQTGDKDTKDKVDNGTYPFYVRSDNVERINSYSFDGEAVLTSGDGVGVGKIYHYIKGKFDYHQRVYNISNFDNRMLGKFFYYYFSNNFYRRVFRMSAKNSVDSVRMEMISKMNIPVPSLDEQSRIVEVLQTWDEYLEKLVKKIEMKKNIKKGLMQQLLSGERRLEGFSGEWEKLNFNSVYTPLKKPKGIKTTNYLEKGKLPIIDQSKDTLISGYTNDESKSYQFKEEAVIIFGDHSRVVKYVDFKVCFGNDGIKVLQTPDNFDTKFAYYKLKNFHVPDTGYNRHFKYLKNAEFLFPKLLEQKAIVEIINSAGKEIERLEEKRGIIAEQKRFLLNNLITGNIRLPEFVN